LDSEINHKNSSHKHTGQTVNETSKAFSGWIRSFEPTGYKNRKKEYQKRSHIEAVYSFLKTQYNLAVNKGEGLKNVTSYALFSLLCLVLNREAAENIRRPDKAVSPTYFNT
jgi:hypothetical protein